MRKKAVVIILPYSYAFADEWICFLKFIQYLDQ